MTTETTYFWLLVTLAFSVMLLAGFFVRALKWRPALRLIPGYDALPRMMDAALEADRPAHLSIGSAGVGQESSIAALAALAVIYTLVKRQAFTQQVPLLTVTDPVSLAIAHDTVRRAYLSRQNRAAYRTSSVLWFPQSERSLAFGAGAASVAASSGASGTALLGEFGSELAYLGESSARHDQQFVGHSTRLAGQAIAFAQSATPLIGEELFAGGGYTRPEASFELGGVIALDVLRWAAIVAIVVIAITNA